VSDRSMRGENFHRATGWQAPSWPEMIRELAADPTPYGEWGVSVIRGGIEREPEHVQE
jgi:hypothetical protein